MTDSDKKKDTDWKVYLLLCSDNTYYCGITNKSVDERIKVHTSGKGAKYTRSRIPLSLVTFVDGLSRSEASKIEIQVKKKPKFLKQRFIDTLKLK